MAEGRFWKEVGQMFDQKLSQGTSELGQALNSGADAYVPYGAGQAPLEIEGPATSYTDMLREAASREAPEQEQSMDR
jgi:hypothetical protein